jgi:hypothetical protein
MITGMISWRSVASSLAPLLVHRIGHNDNRTDALSLTFLFFKGME